MTPRQKTLEFETAIERLEEIVSVLESGEASLEESMELYTEGVRLAEVCNSRLKDAEGKIAKLSRLAETFAEEPLAVISAEDDDE